MKGKDIEEFLINLKDYGIKNDIPNVSFINARFLRDLIKIKKPNRLLEIGTANAFSTINMAIECETYGWQIDTIEFSERAYKIAQTNIKETWLDNTITQFNWNALDVIPKLSEWYDFIFIDGMKRRTKDFFTLSYPLLNTWWIIIIDDVILFKEKMLDLYDYLEKESIIYNVIPIDVNDGVIMIVK